MKIKILQTLYSNRKNSIFRNQKLTKLLLIGLRFKVGEIFGSIYVKEKKGKGKLDNVLIKKSMNYFDSIIRKTLEKHLNSNQIDFDKKGLENIGTGCVFIPSIMGKMIIFTQKQAEFYFKIEKNQNPTLRINLISIPKVSGKIEFEDETLQKFSLTSFSEKEISIEIKNELIKYKISKIKISVDRCWNMHNIFKILPNFPLGIGLKSISIEN